MNVQLKTEISRIIPVRLHPTDLDYILLVDSRLTVGGCFGLIGSDLGGPQAGLHKVKQCLQEFFAPCHF